MQLLLPLNCALLLLFALASILKRASILLNTLNTDRFKFYKDPVFL